MPPPQRVNRDLPEEIDRVILKALQRNRDLRYPDAAAFRAAIEGYIAAQGLKGTPQDVADYLRGLYADRIATEADPLKLDQLAKDVDVDSQSNSSRDGMPTSGARGQAASRASKLVGPAVPSAHARGAGEDAEHRGPGAGASERCAWVPFVGGRCWRW